MHSVSPYELSDNAFELIDREWMLISAGSLEHHNTMTASWGGLGILWDKPVAFIFIRPQRHTLQFVEAYDTFTLSFFGQGYRHALNLCGTVSGRDCNKIAEAGLTPVSHGSSIAFAQARMVMECKKLYAQNIDSTCFVDKALIQKVYPTSDFHRMFIGEISAVHICD